MDPITQGALGAALPVSTRRRTQTGIAGVVGFLAGMAPDLDVFIRSPTDSLLFLEYHRQFTHSFFFVPMGSFIVSALLYVPLRRWTGISFRMLWLFAALGYATHGLLDAATSYGTQLLWPVSNTRFSLSIVSIIDPLLTLPLIALVGLGIIRKNGKWSRTGLLWVLCYLGFGAYQHQTAKSLAYAQAAERGHIVERLAVKPTFANLVVWKSIYETDGRFYVDAVRPGFSAGVSPGAAAEKLDIQRDFPWLGPDTQQGRDIRRFAQFSDDYLARASDGSERIIDVRYSFLPNEIAPLWSIKLDPTASPETHVTYETHRGDARRDLEILIRMIIHGFGGLTTVAPRTN